MPSSHTNINTSPCAPATQNISSDVTWRKAANTTMQNSAATTVYAPFPENYVKIGDGHRKGFRLNSLQEPP